MPPQRRRSPPDRGGIRKILPNGRRYPLSKWSKLMRLLWSSCLLDMWCNKVLRQGSRCLQDRFRMSQPPRRRKSRLHRSSKRSFRSRSSYLLDMWSTRMIP